MQASRQLGDHSTGVADGWFVDVEDDWGPLPTMVEQAINDAIAGVVNEDTRTFPGLEYKLGLVP